MPLVDPSAWCASWPNELLVDAVGQLRLGRVDAVDGLTLARDEVRRARDRVVDDVVLRRREVADLRPHVEAGTRGRRPARRRPPRTANAGGAARLGRDHLVREPGQFMHPSRSRPCGPGRATRRVSDGTVLGAAHATPVCIWSTRLPMTASHSSAGGAGRSIARVTTDAEREQHAQPADRLGRHRTGAISPTSCPSRMTSESRSSRAAMLLAQHGRHLRLSTARGDRLDQHIPPDPRPAGAHSRDQPCSEEFRAYRPPSRSRPRPAARPRHRGPDGRSRRRAGRPCRRSARRSPRCSDRPPRRSPRPGPLVAAGRDHAAPPRPAAALSYLRWCPPGVDPRPRSVTNVRLIVHHRMPSDASPACPASVPRRVATSLLVVTLAVGVGVAGTACSSSSPGRPSTPPRRSRS